MEERRRSKTKHQERKEKTVAVKQQNVIFVYLAQGSKSTYGASDRGDSIMMQ
jgi:hypothetical protein